MRRITLSASFAVLAVCGLGGCPDGGSSPPSTPAPPASTCRETLADCTSSTDCCGTCFAGFCAESAQGGQCATSDDCVDPYLCVNYACATAACRQDQDVCSLATQCCAGRCRQNGTCGPNRAPTVALPTVATLDKGLTRWLTATASDPDGDTLTYAWTLTPPEGSTAALSSASAASPSLTPDVAGVYGLGVTVSDGQYTASASGSITAVNTAPVARAGGNRSAPRNTPVPLDASASSDLNLDPLSFSWSLTGPDGSTATLSSTTDPKPAFTPDLLGAYVATVVASDGDLTSSASVTITSTNTAPVPRPTGVTAVNAGEAATLTAATSTDQNGDPLTFTWSLRGPIGTAATLTATTGTTTGFTTDLMGAYYVTLVASDGYTTATAYATVQAHPHLAKLSHDVVAAAYSKVTDRLITVSATPASALWILDPVTEVEQRVDLPAGPPVSVGVSADGLAAVVGRNGGITHVDLATATVLGDCVTQWTDNGTVPASTWNFDVGGVSVGQPHEVGTKQAPRTARFAYASPGGAANAGDFGMAVDLGSCAKSWDWYSTGYYAGASALRPGQASEQLYVRNNASQETFYVYAVPSGPLGTRVEVRPDSYCTGGMWFAEDGSRFVCGSGHVYDANPQTTATSTHFPLRGSLGNLAPGSFQRTLHADHCALRQHLSIVPRNDTGQTEADAILKRFSFSSNATATSYALITMDTVLPTIVVDGALYPGHGRYVFYRSDGSTRYVVLRTSPTAGITLFAVASAGP